MFEEVKEMIDSTVYTNGNGEVTAQNINLAMQGIVEATEEKITEVENKVAEIEENGTGGSGALKVWYWNEDEGLIPTEEQTAENIATYNTLLGGSITSVILCQTLAFPEDNFETTQIINADVQVVKFNGGDYVILQCAYPTEPGSNAVQTLMIQFNADGTMQNFYGEDKTSEGGSGALKVWIEDAENGIFLTEEQKAENVATYNVLIEGEHVPVIVCNKYEMSGEGFSASQTTTCSISYAALKYSSSGENREDVMFFLGDNMESVFILHSDGTIELTEEPSTPASSGQWVIYSGTINADGTATLSDEEKSANMSIYNALMSGQVMPIVYKQDLTQVMGYARIWSNVVADVYPEYGVQIKASYAASLNALEQQNFVLNPDGTLDFDAI